MSTTHAHKRPTRRLVLASAGAALVAGLAVVVATALPASGNGWEAKAILRDANGVRVGTVNFDGDGQGTMVKVSLNGVTAGLDGFHGLHIHANDGKAPCDATGAFVNVGGHWNPTAAMHGNHRGDLPSIIVQADGTGTARVVTGRFEPRELDGRAVILHAGPDNFANVPDRYSTGTPPVAGPDVATKGTGDSGGRIACGIIDVS
jgi:superoxide dismutase, Cu-Zn family